MASSVPEAEDAMAAARAPARRAADPATILGLGGALGLIAVAAYLGGSAVSFVNLPSIMIVIGGTFAVTTICFTLPEIYHAQRMVRRALFRPLRNPSEAALQMLRVAAAARRNGVLALQHIAEEAEHEPFLRQALMLVADGNTGEVIEAILKSEIGATASRHAKGASVLRKAAEVAPTMGLIGTLVGLVQMLGRLNDPGAIGPAMAVALLTTFYGAILSTVVLAPLASKLERNSREELLVKNIYLMAAASIGRKENPRRLEMALNSLLPPAHRVRFFD